MSPLFKLNSPSITNRRQTSQMHRYRVNRKITTWRIKRIYKMTKYWKVCSDVTKYHRTKMVLNTEIKSQLLFSEILCYYRVRPKRPGILFTEGRAAGLHYACLAALAPLCWDWLSHSTQILVLFLYTVISPSFLKPLCIIHSQQCHNIKIGKNQSSNHSKDSKFFR